jgi:hypothetical protein
MRKILLLLLVLTPTILECQTSKGEFALGASVGTRIAIEGRLGSHQFLDGKHDGGYDLLFSMWFRSFASEEPVPVNVGQIASTWSLMDTWDRISGIGLGARYFPSFWGAGLSVDFVHVERYQKWIIADQVTQVDIEQDPIIKLGISANLAFRLSSRWTADCWLGNRRGFLVGATYSL